MIGVPPAAAGVLRMIIRNPGCRARALMDHFGVNKTTMQNHVRALCKLGLVHRAPVEKGFELYPKDPLPPWREMTASETGAHIARVAAMLRGHGKTRAAQQRRELRQKREEDPDYDPLPMRQRVVPVGEWQLDHRIPRASVFDIRP